MLRFIAASVSAFRYNRGSIPIASHRVWMLAGVRSRSREVEPRRSTHQRSAGEGSTPEGRLRRRRPMVERSAYPSPDGKGLYSFVAVEGRVSRTVAGRAVRDGTTAIRSRARPDNRCIAALDSGGRRDLTRPIAQRRPCRRATAARLRCPSWTRYQRQRHDSTLTPTRSQTPSSFQQSATLARNSRPKLLTSRGYSRMPPLPRVWHPR